MALRRGALRLAQFWQGGVAESGVGTGYRMSFRNTEGQTISPWHDIPLFHPSGGHTYINEIPKGGRAKMEVNPKEEGNALKQDVKKGNLRFYTYGDIPFNYGMMPRTWEDPGMIDPASKLGGDGDPLDVCEIGGELGRGEVVGVKVLASLAMIDEGEMDWKVIAIANSHPLAHKMHDIHDLERLIPGKVDQIRHWFRYYKTTDGKPENNFAFNGWGLDRDRTLQVVAETHLQWCRLRAGKAGSKGAEGIWDGRRFL